MSLEKAFGVALKKVREKRELTQLKLAERSGLDVTYISLLERGHRQPSLKAFLALAAGLEIQAAELLKETLKGLSK